MRIEKLSLAADSAAEERSRAEDEAGAWVTKASAAAAAVRAAAPTGPDTAAKVRAAHFAEAASAAAAAVACHVAAKHDHSSGELKAANDALNRSQARSAALSAEQVSMARDIEAARQGAEEALRDVLRLQDERVRVERHTIAALCSRLPAEFSVAQKAAAAAASDHALSVSRLRAAERTWATVMDRYGAALQVEWEESEATGKSDAETMRLAEDLAVAIDATVSASRIKAMSAAADARVALAGGEPGGGAGASNTQWRDAALKVGRLRGVLLSSSFVVLDWPPRVLTTGC